MTRSARLATILAQSWSYRGRIEAIANQPISYYGITYIIGLYFPVLRAVTFGNRYCWFQAFVFVLYRILLQVELDHKQMPFILEIRSLQLETLTCS